MKRHGIPVLAALLASACGGGRTEVRMSAADLLANETWEVVAERADGPVRRAVISPSPRGELGGLGRPALVLAPPAEVVLRVPALEVPLDLSLLAGADSSVARETGRATISFEVDVNGARVFTGERTFAPDLPRARRLWLRVGGSPRIEVSAGDEIRLRTRLVAYDGPEPAPPLLAGFARVHLDRRVLVEREPAGPAHPNIVLVVLDTQRRDRLSSYGYERPTTPNIDALAARGLVYTNAYATSSWTWPSTASILTGLLPEEHGVVDRYVHWHLPSGVDTLAEVLQRAGYATAAWSGNPLVDSRANFDQGFERFGPEPPGFRHTNEFIDDVRAWIAENRGWRFFLYLQLIDPHDPYEPGPVLAARFVGPTPAGFPKRPVQTYSRALRRNAFEHGRTIDEIVPPEHLRHIEDLYDGAVATGDHYVGLVLAELEEQGLTDDTVVVLTADHGEELLDHGHLNHGQGLHRELTGVPLILAGPGIPSGRRVATTVSNRCLAPTLARLAGTALPGPEDVWDLARPDDLREHEVFFSTSRGFRGGPERPLYGMIADGYALHDWIPLEGRRPRLREEHVELYDLRADPGERHDVAGREPERAAAMRDRLRRRIELSRTHAVERLELEAGATTIESLRELGYLGEDE